MRKVDTIDTFRMRWTNTCSDLSPAGQWRQPINSARAVLSLGPVHFCLWSQDVCMLSRCCAAVLITIRLYIIRRCVWAFAVMWVTLTKNSYSTTVPWFFAVRRHNLDSWYPPRLVRLLTAPAPQSSDRTKAVWCSDSSRMHILKIFETRIFTNFKTWNDF